MDWGHYLFGFSGRINRARIWLFLLLSLIFWSVFWAIGWLVVGNTLLSLFALGLHPWPITALAGGAIAFLFGLFYLAAWCLYLFVSLAVTVKRLHDRDKSAWWLLVFWLLPLMLHALTLNQLLWSLHTGWPVAPGAMTARLAGLAITIWAFVELYCLPGTVGPNRFGPDPLPPVSPDRPA